MNINEDGAVCCTMAEWLERGPGVCKQNNVRWVTITDKTPLIMPSGSDFEYFWLFSFAATQDCVLPQDVFPEAVVARNGKRFPTTSEAEDWLSCRLIAWATATNNYLKLQLE